MSNDDVVRLLMIKTPKKLQLLLYILFLLACFVAVIVMIQYDRQQPLTQNKDSSHRINIYQQARSRASAWLDHLVVDPVALRRIGTKGKKRYTEVLDAYLVLYRSAHTEQERAGIRDRIQDFAEHTQRAEYHDLDTATDLQFKQDILSYLRALWILRHFGLSTATYDTKASQLQDRIQAHLSHRGPHQLASFALYYDAFGWPKPLALQEDVLAHGVIANRVPLEQFTRQLSYDLTHEIYAVFGFGLKTPAAQFQPADRDGRKI